MWHAAVTGQGYGQECADFSCITDTVRKSCSSGLTCKQCPENATQCAARQCLYDYSMYFRSVCWCSGLHVAKKLGIARYWKVVARPVKSLFKRYLTLINLLGCILLCHNEFDVRLTYVCKMFRCRSNSNKSSSNNSSNFSGDLCADTV